jgi:hypothetical protein
MNQKGYIMALSKQDQEARLQVAKDRAAKPQKSKYGTKPQTQEDQKGVNVIPATGERVTSGDQNDVTQAKTKKPRKISPTVVAWKATKNFPLEAKITLNPELKEANPKRRKAADRFALYRNGMTVGEYIEASHKAGNSKALAMADIRWDQAAKFLTVS